MTNKKLNVLTKPCRYGCGKELEWDNDARQWIEVGTKTHHSYPRCRKILQEKGQDVLFS